MHLINSPLSALTSNSFPVEIMQTLDEWREIKISFATKCIESIKNSLRLRVGPMFQPRGKNQRKCQSKTRKSKISFIPRSKSRVIYGLLPKVYTQVHYLLTQCIFFVVKFEIFRYLKGIKCNNKYNTSFWICNYRKVGNTWRAEIWMKKNSDWFQKTFLYDTKTRQFDLNIWLFQNCC